MATLTDAIPGWKREEIDDLSAFLEGATSVAVVDIAGIPSRQLQTMRRDLHGTARLRVSRNTLAIWALEAVDDGIEELVGYVSGQVGLVTAEANPFSLYRQLEASKTPAPIGAGEVAPNDIVIEAGDTGIDPGPFVGDLQNAGVPARIDEGSIKVMETTTVCEAGGTVSPELAGVLNELDLEPKEVGLDLRAVYADGVLFLPEDLAIDVEAYQADVARAAADARALALEAAYPAEGVVAALLARARSSALGVAVDAGVVEPETADAVLSAAAAGGRSLAAAIGDEEVVGSPVEPAPTQADADEPTRDDQPDEEPTEDEAATDESEDDDGAAAEGLGDLFG